MKNQYAEQKKIQDELKQKFVVLREEAKSMLLDQRYNHIKKIYTEAEENTVDLILGYKEQDPIKYKMQMSEWLTELKIFRNFLKIVVDLSQKTKKPRFNFMTSFLKGSLKDLKEQTKE